MDRGMGDGYDDETKARGMGRYEPRQQLTNFNSWPRVRLVGNGRHARLAGVYTHAQDPRAVHRYTDAGGQSRGGVRGEDVRGRVGVAGWTCSSTSRGEGSLMGRRLPEPRWRGARARDGGGVGGVVVRGERGGCTARLDDP